MDEQFYEEQIARGKALYREKQPEMDGGKSASYLANLLHNACRYTPEGGRISVSVNDAEDHVFVRIANDCAEVSATGPLFYFSLLKRSSGH